MYNACPQESGAEFHDVKQQENVLGETLLMIPDTEDRLKSAFHDLHLFIAQNYAKLFDEQSVFASAASSDGSSDPSSEPTPLEKELRAIKLSFNEAADALPELHSYSGPPQEEEEI